MLQSNALPFVDLARERSRNARIIPIYGGSGVARRWNLAPRGTPLETWHEL